MTPLLSLFVGLAALVGGGELLVRGAVAAARQLGVSPLLIGVTLVGFGTSTPELLTSVRAAMEGAPGIAVGNVVGSNTANILLILGIAALLRPIAVDVRAVRRDAGVMLAAAIAGSGALLALGGVGRGTGVVFLLALAAYVVWTYRAERGRPQPSAELHAAEADIVRGPQTGLAVALLLAVVGLAMTLLGAGWLVDGAVWLARAGGVSDAVIGLTVVAVGTSLPELSAGIVAALRGHSDVALGNVLGSNIYNVLGILGATGVIAPIATPSDLGTIDVLVMLGATLILLPMAATGRRIGRGEGSMFLILYVGYVSYLIL